MLLTISRLLRICQLRLRLQSPVQDIKENFGISAKRYFKPLNHYSFMYLDRKSNFD